MATSTGLLVVACAYAFGRAQYPTAGLVLFWLGMLMIFVPALFRLLNSEAGRPERFRVSLLLGVGLFFAQVSIELTRFSLFDEMLHVRTSSNVTTTGQLFVFNSNLPVSPRYPGLELLTNAVIQLTGASNQVAGLIVLTMARIVLVIGIFLLVERATESSHAAGIAVAIYACSPQFFFFNAQFSYQTVAICFSVMILLQMEYRQAPGWGTRVLLVASSICLAVSHHATGWITIAILALSVVAAAGRREGDLARDLLRFTFICVVVVALWTFVSGRILGQYIQPVIQDAIQQLTGIATGTSEPRKLSTDPGGIRNPRWETALIAASALVWAVSLLPLGPFRARPTNGGSSSITYPVFRLMHIMYPVTLLVTVAPKAAELSTRLSTFLFLGIALVVGFSLASYIRGVGDRLRKAILIVVGVVTFMGGTMLGSGLDWNRIPGSYMVIADGRSIDRYAVSAALWASSNMFPESRFISDRENGALISAQGRQEQVVTIGSDANAGQILFADNLVGWERALIADNRIRYAVIDRRMLDGPAHEVYYLVAGEAPQGTRLTQAHLDKFDTTPGSVLIYDNGPIKIYDISGLWSRTGSERVR
jgi:hypothetical protein